MKWNKWMLAWLEYVLRSPLSWLSRCGQLSKAEVKQASPDLPFKPLDTHLSHLICMNSLVNCSQRNKEKESGIQRFRETSALRLQESRHFLELHEAKNPRQQNWPYSLSDTCQSQQHMAIVSQYKLMYVEKDGWCFPLRWLFSPSVIFVQELAFALTCRKHPWQLYEFMLQRVVRFCLIW